MPGPSGPLSGSTGIDGRRRRGGVEPFNGQRPGQHPLEDRFDRSGQRVIAGSADELVPLHGATPRDQPLVPSPGLSSAIFGIVRRCSLGDLTARTIEPGQVVALDVTVEGEVSEGSAGADLGTPALDPAAPLLAGEAGAKRIDGLLPGGTGVLPTDEWFQTDAVGAVLGVAANEQPSSFQGTDLACHAPHVTFGVEESAVAGLLRTADVAGTSATAAVGRSRSGLRGPASGPGSLRGEGSALPCVRPLLAGCLCHPARRDMGAPSGSDPAGQQNPHDRESSNHASPW
jgi:hypothetical protein